MSQNFLVSRETGAGESGDLERNKSDEAPWHPAGSRAAAWWCQQKLIRVWWLWWLAHKEFVTNSSPQQWIERERDAICSFHVVLLIYWQWKIFIWFPTLSSMRKNKLTCTYNIYKWIFQSISISLNNLVSSMKFLCQDKVILIYCD